MGEKKAKDLAETSEIDARRY